MRFIAFDFETGGLTTDTSPLEGCFIVFNHKFNKLGELEMKIKPNGNDPYVVTAGALEVNGIDLIKHNEEAIPLDEAKKRLFNFLREMSEDGRYKLIPFGQNITFDRDFIFEHFMSKGNWDKYCSYHTLDTTSIAVFFKLLGLMPVEQKTRLGLLADYFGVKTGDLHTAKADTEACIGILLKMIKKIKGGMIHE